MGFSYLIAGLVFLFNPNVNIIDVLPDAIGYALIIAGLKKLADFYTPLNASRKIFKTLMLISVIKIAVAYFTYRFITDKGFLLIFTFVFSFFEIIYMISAFDKLFDSLLYLGTRHDGTAVFNRISETKTITFIFIIARSVLPVLPELTFLSETAGDEGYVTYAEPVNYADFKDIFVAASVVLIVAIGIIWLVMMIRYFVPVAKDKKFLANLNAYYNEVILPDTYMFIRRRLMFAYSVILFGMLFMFDLFADGVNIIPDFIGMAICIIGFIALIKHSKRIAYAIIPAVCFIASDMTAWILLNQMTDKYYIYHRILSGNDLQKFNIICGISAVAAVSFAVTMVLLVYSTWKIINEHTEIITTRQDDELTIAKNRSIKKMLKTRSVVFLTASAAAAVSGSLQYFMMFDSDTYIFINLVVTVLWFISAVALISKLNEQIQNRYYG